MFQDARNRGDEIRLQFFYELTKVNRENYDEVLSGWVTLCEGGLERERLQLNTPANVMLMSGPQSISFMYAAC